MHNRTPPILPSPLPSLPFGPITTPILTAASALQISPRTRWLVMHDWIRAALFGRNISDV